MEEYSTNTGEPTSEELSEIVENDNLILSDELLTIMVAIGEKRGSCVEGFFNDEDEFENFLDLLNGMGVNCFVKRNVETTELEGLINAFEDDEDVEMDNSREMANRDVVVKMYLTKEDFEKDYFKELERLGSNYNAAFHRKSGRFYGYPETDIEAFVFDNKSRWQKVLLSLFGRDKPKPLMDDEALEKYGEELSNQEKRIFEAFTFHKIADNEESFQKQLSKVKARKKAMEKYDLDVDHYVEAMVFE